MTDAPGRISLQAIEAFLAAADEGSVMAAARRLAVSASGVSQLISGLESALGVVLFDRSGRPRQLTPAGDTFRRHAQAIANELAAARAAIGLAGLSGLSNFRLGFIEDFEAEVTPSLLSDLGRDWPGCQFLLETGPSHRLHEQLDARALDLIVAADMGAATDMAEVHTILEEPFVAVVPKGRGLGATQVASANFALPLILYTARHHMGRQIADALARQNVRLGHRFELDSYHSIMAMVAAGSGWTILTPLGVLHASRFHDKVDLLPLPLAPLSRRIAVSARRGILGAMPADIAARLRRLLQDMIVTPVLADHPWMKDGLKVIGP